MTEAILRFLIGGTIVSIFAVLADLFEPKSFGGIFGAAPSIRSWQVRCLEACSSHSRPSFPLARPSSQNTNARGDSAKVWTERS
jgi:hypothetical protein